MDYDNPPSGGKIALWVGIAVVVVIGVSLGIYFLVFATANDRGRIQASNQINGATNRIGQYDHFFDEWQAYRAQVASLPTLTNQLKAFNASNPPGTNDPFGQIAQQRNEIQTSLTGLEQQCINTATSFNTDSQRNYTETQFKASNLPYTLSVSACTPKGN